ncbi:MAG: hypothetical protein OEQ18_18425, partial [Gammaproteobacteria bacterium]|nr:hypothetical protein [Gammaproteobacteria bacterium]
RGVNAHTLEVLMTYSPIVEHLGVNLWSIAGVTVDPAAVEAVRAANALRPKEKRVTDFGWTEEGNVWISVIVPSYHTSSFVFGIPGGVKKYLIGQRFTVLDASGKEFGQFAVNDDGTAYGAGSFLRRKGADTGDVILCEFNLPNNTVVLTIGGDEILQDM